LTVLFEVEESVLRAALEKDFNRTGNRGMPRFLRTGVVSERSGSSGRAAERQGRHGA
jgi:hypothetical protein